MELCLQRGGSYRGEFTHSELTIHAVTPYHDVFDVTEPSHREQSVTSSRG